MIYVLVFGGGFVIVAGLFWIGQWLSGEGPSWAAPVAMVIGFIVTVLAAVFVEAAKNAT